MPSVAVSPHGTPARALVYNQALMTLTLSRTGDETRLLARVSARLLPFLLVLYVISYLDRINLIDLDQVVA